MQARINALEARLKKAGEDKFISKESGLSRVLDSFVSNIGDKKSSRPEPDQTYKAYSIAAQGIIKRKRINM